MTKPPETHIAPSAAAAKHGATAFCRLLATGIRAT